MAGKKGKEEALIKKHRRQDGLVLGDILEKRCRHYRLGTLLMTDFKKMVSEAER
jgi:hypothetical protein